MIFETPTTARSTAVLLDDSADGETRLPFNYEAPLRAYLYCGIPTGIITAQQRPLLGPVAQYHAQLFFPFRKICDPKGDHKFRMIAGMTVDDFARADYFRVTRWDPDEVEAMDPAVLIERLFGALEAGRYLHVYIDEYFIPETPFYLRQHFRHEGLLIGCSRQSGAFFHLTYRSDRTWGSVPVPMRDYAASFALMKHGLQVRVKQPAVREIELLVPPRKSVSYPEMVAQLEDYGKGRGRIADYRPGGRFSLTPEGQPAQDLDGAVGFGIYPPFREHVLQAAAGETTLDLRATRVLMEHKLLLLEEGRRLSPAATKKTLVEKLARQVDLSRQIHLLAFSFATEYDVEAGVRILKLLNALEREERETIPELAGAFSRAADAGGAMG